MVRLAFTILVFWTASRFAALIRGKPVLFLFFAGTFWAISSAVIAREDDTENLTREFQRLSHEFYQAKARKTSRHKNFEELYRQANSAFDAGDPMNGITTIVANIDLIEANISNIKTLFFVNRLLEHNEWTSAQKLFDYATQSGDPYTTSKFNYLFANYFFERNHWDKARDHLTAIEFQNALTKAESDYATILAGIILQMHKKHRESVTFYDRVPEDSDYFSYAQLNKAVAFIRQGWWTDAHIAIDKALGKTSPESMTELHNRLYLVLGYSQLQHEFYRDARETFRQIELNSRYVNQALLGIGLCALHQGDFVGALNAFELLKKKQSDDMYVTESYLLLAFVHEQMGQETTASAHYTEAIAYYQGRISATEAEAVTIRGKLSAADPLPAYRDLTENLLSALPASALADAARLERFSQAGSDPALLTKIDGLKQKYDRALLSLASDALDERKKSLQSYLSQSQFGVAKLFDSDQ